VTFLTLLQSRPPPRPPQSPPPITVGGSGWQGTGYWPPPRRQEIEDDEEAQPQVACEVKLIEPTGGGILAPHIVGAVAAMAGLALLAPLVNPGDPPPPTRKTRKHDNPAAEPVQARAATPPSMPLHELPVARGRATGKPCWVCGVRQELAAYPRNARGGPGRICQRCCNIDAVRTFERACAVCGAAFESNSQRASLCSEECRAVRRAETRGGNGKNGPPDDENEPE